MKSEVDTQLKHVKREEAILIIEKDSAEIMRKLTVTLLPSGTRRWKA